MGHCERMMIMRKSTFFLVFVAALFGAAKAGLAQDWQQIEEAGGPGNASTPELVFDLSRSVLVLYSVSNVDGSLVSEVWESSDDIWSLRKIGCRPAFTTRR